MLLIDLQEADVSDTNRLPKLLLYGCDSVLERVQSYSEHWPLPDATIVALIEHISFKIEQLSALKP